MGRGSLGYHYITSRRNHSYSIRVEQLAIPLTYLTELKLEIALLIKNLNSVIGLSPRIAPRQRFHLKN